MRRKLTIPVTIFQKTWQWVSSSPHTNLWNVFHFTQPVPIIHKEQVFEEWKASYMPRDSIWTVKCFYRLWLKEWKIQKDTALDALYSDLDLEQETEKGLRCSSVMKMQLPLKCVRYKQHMSKSEKIVMTKSSS